MAYDLLVKGGLVVDPSQDIHGIRDIALSRGKVAAVEGGIPSGQAKNVVDASCRWRRLGEGGCMGGESSSHKEGPKNSAGQVQTGRDTWYYWGRLDGYRPR